MTTPNALEKHWQENRAAWTFSPIETFGIVLLVIAAIVAIWGYLSQHNTLTIGNVLQDFYANVSSELASIVITVFILDRLNQRRAREERTLELFRQAKSRSNSVAIDAIDQISHDELWDDFRVHFPHVDNRVYVGEVQWNNVNLSQVNLNRADIYQASFASADLRGSYFENADFFGSNFRLANLEKANFKNATIKQCDLEEASMEYIVLEGAILDGTNLKYAI